MKKCVNAGNQKKKPEFILAQDADGCWYVIPADKQGEFDKWVRSAAWDKPDFVVEVGRSYRRVRFTGFTL